MTINELKRSDFHTQKKKLESYYISHEKLTQNHRGSTGHYVPSGGSRREAVSLSFEVPGSYPCSLIHDVLSCSTNTSR